MFRRAFRQGDPVIFCRVRHKSHPGRKAQGVRPARHGDDYSYFVEKLWTVSAVLDDGRLELLTPRGRKHIVNATDPCLRHPSWLSMLRYRLRFWRNATSSSAS